MKPGFYVVRKDTLLADGSSHIRLHRGDWLVTDSEDIGRFDKHTEMDWLPLEWTKGKPLRVYDGIEDQLNAVPISWSRLEDGFRELLFVEPGEPTPDFPKPPLLSGLAMYLRQRKFQFGYQR